MSKDKNHTTSRQKFLNYLEGDLSDKKANAFERDVLQSDFEQEALEGFEGNDPAIIKEDLINLSSRISDTPNNWWKVAAAVSFLVVSGISIWIVTSRPYKQETIAMKEKEDMAVNPDVKDAASPEVQVDFLFPLESQPHRRCHRG